MSQEDPNDPAEMTEKIEIFSTDDEKIKSFGELLTNDSSRAILQILFKEEMTANEIAQKTGVSLQLVKYHINKMQDMGIIKVSKVEKNTKAQDMKYYTATKFAIVILPKAVSEKAKESKSLLRSFKILYKFAGVGIATVSAFFATQSVQNFTITDDLRQNTGSISLDRSVSDESEWTSASEEQTEPVAALAPEDTDERAFQSGEEAGGDAEFTLEDSSATTSEPVAAPEAAPTHSGIEEFDQDNYADSSGSETLDESLELAQRKIQAAEANSADGSGTGIFGAENFWPIIVAIAVLGAGLALVFYWQAYRHPKIYTGKLSLFGIVFLAFTFALKYFR